jgi:NAD(P)-dependent dehydrogenase (short-subunit alcohol dehydrogenase family)
MVRLEGRIALVAGATRGAGRGIARMLGEAGATVYCSGRSSRGGAPSPGPHARRRETIEETAELVTADGGRGIAVRVDHGNEQEVTALMDRIRSEHKRLDILVNVAGGPEVHDRFKSFWTIDVESGRVLFDAWVWPHVLTCKHAIPLMTGTKGSKRAVPGLVVEVMEGETLGYAGHFYWDLTVTTLKRLAYALGEELAPHKIAAIAVAPGFMRTEAILDHFGATPQNWLEIAQTNKEAIGFGFAGSETPCYVGRGIAALAADPKAMRKSGRVVSSSELSDEYGFSDIDGRRPHWVSYFQEKFAGMFGKPKVAVEWKQADMSR